MTARRAGWFLAGLLVLGAPGSARAQIFFSSRPNPDFTIGPLMIRASVAEETGPVEVQVLWSIVLPPRRSPEEVAQDLYLLWPGEIRGGTLGEKPDPGLARYVEALGFSVIDEGRVPLALQSLDESAPRVQVPGGASFVTFVQTSGALGLSPPATWIRIPWSPRLAARAWLMDLRVKVAGLIKPRQATWAERLFVGGRYRITISFNEVRDRPLFPMYFIHRDRVVRLADAPAELVVAFARADRLKIDEIFPPTSIRRISETLESTEVVSLFLDRGEGLTPQHLAVQFGYFSRVQAAALVLIPMLFFILGNAMGPVLGRVAIRLGEALASRLHWGPWSGAPRTRQTGVVIPREVLEKIVPGETHQEEVLRLCGREAEVQERWAAPDRRTLVYRGRRLVPEARRLLGWLSAVRRWDVERHEVRIEIEGDVVRDVQAQVRRYRLGDEEIA